MNYDPVQAHIDKRKKKLAKMQQQGAVQQQCYGQQYYDQNKLCAASQVHTVPYGANCHGQPHVQAVPYGANCHGQLHVQAVPYGAPNIMMTSMPQAQGYAKTDFGLGASYGHTVT